MDIDWKDALGALKDSGAIPIDNTPDLNDDDKEENALQKTPLHVVIDRKGRNGKTATIIEGFTGSDDALAELAKTLKRKLGTGGSHRDGEILIQGDRKRETISILQSLGYRTKG